MSVDTLRAEISVIEMWQHDGAQFLRDSKTYTSNYSWQAFASRRPELAKELWLEMAKPGWIEEAAQ